MIGSPHAYLGVRFEFFVIGYPRDLHVNYAPFFNLKICYRYD